MANKFDEIVHGKASDEESSKKVNEKIQDDDLKEINIRFKIRPRLYERIIYVLVILALVFLVFRSPFCDSGWGWQSSNDSEEVQVEEPVVEEPEEQTEESEEDTDEPPEEPPTELTIDASLSFKPTDVITINSTGTSYKVEKVNFKIVNSGDILRGKVILRWYDEDDDKTMEEKIRASKSLIVPGGETMAFSATEFAGSYLNSANEQETFILELTDAEGNELDSKEVVVTP